MESPSESNIQSRDGEAHQPIERRKVPQPPEKPSGEARELRRLHEDASLNIVPDEPNPREIEAGANQALAFFQEYTGGEPLTTPMDEETQRIFYALHQQREGWSDAVEANARTALQVLYPDVGGSRAHGPL